MRRLESRRLTGRGLLLDRPGAVLEVALGEEGDRAIELWRVKARWLLDELGWGGETVAVRRFPGGASLAISAPLDALYAATELNEAAWDAASGDLAGTAYPYQEEVERLTRRIRAERNPCLLAL